MNYAHLDTAMMEQAMSRCPRCADYNDQAQHEHCDPRPRHSQVIEHLPGSKLFRKVILSVFVSNPLKRNVPRQIVDGDISRVCFLDKIQ